MDKSQTYVVLMAGGAGTRLWPYSRRRHPKQFIDLLGSGRTLIQMTYDRMLDFVDVSNMYVVTHKEQMNLVSEQLPDLPRTNILAEPTSRNTAPCIAYAVYKIKQQCDEAMIIVVPSDHVIRGKDAFYSCLQTALKGAQTKGRLVTLGIRPTEPNTGFGYIQFFDKKTAIASLHKVKTYTEKPNRALAKKFLDSGDFAWNAGIFVWRLSAIISAFERHIPEIAEVFSDGMQHYNTQGEAAFLARAYALVPNISIDYAVMEKQTEVYVVLCDFQWSDLGSWQAVYELHTNANNTNVFIGEKGLVYEGQNNLVCAKGDKLVVLDGLKGYVVVDSDDVLLIYRKENASGLRAIVRDIRNKKGKKYL